MNYRTMEPNPILELIALPVKDLEVLKIGKVGEISDLSYFSAQNWIRTSTPLQALRPEHSASTNFAIWATDFVFQDGKDRNRF